MLLNTTTVIRGIALQYGTSPSEPLAEASIRLGRVAGARFTELGRTLTDDGGEFTFDLSSLPDVQDGTATLELRVFQGRERLQAYGDVRWRASIHPGPLVVCAVVSSCCGTPPESPPNLDNNNVWGRVRHHDGTPVASAQVEVRAVTMTGEPLLVSTTTDSSGWYKATFTPPQDLFVVVLEPGTTPRLVERSAVYYSPSTPVRIDIDVDDDAYRQSTEFSRLSSAITPLLSGTNPEDLTTRHVALLAGSTGWDVDRVALWALAHKMGDDFSADDESLYGLLRMGFPRNNERMLCRPRATVGPALTRAAGLHVIASSKADNPSLASFESALETAHAAVLNSTRADTVGTILRTSGNLSTGQISDFLSLQASHTGTEDAFWTAVEALSSFTSTDVTEAQRLLTVGKIALQFGPLVTQILSQIGSNAASAVAELTQTQWETLVGNLSGSLPDGLPGDTQALQEEALVGYLMEHAELTFPSVAARSGLIQRLASGHEARTFLESNAGFDILLSRVDDSAFTGTTAQMEATSRFQRLCRVAPSVGRASGAKTLDDEGLSSGWDVARMGRSRFLAEHGSAFETTAMAEEVVRKAMSLNALTSMFLLQAHPSNSQVDYDFVPNEDFDTADIEDWDTLFPHAVVGCSCRHCHSVHGPAAYLVDLLQWLEARKGTDNNTLYDTLVGRRPDLVQIALSCENTERAMPYIDLVLEALESAVVGSGSVGTDAAHDTEVSTDDMLASPQYRNDTAYSTLAGATSAMGLPYHRPLHEQRTFLAHLGVPRPELLRDFKDSASLDDVDLATEELGLFDDRLETITDTVASEVTYWPVDSTNDLESVPMLLKSAEITWPEALDLLAARIANPHTWSAVYTRWEPRLEVVATDGCDLDTYIIRLFGGGIPAVADWTLVRRTLRLWRTTEWTLPQLDRVLAALGITDLTHWSPTPTPAGWLTKVAAVHRLEAMTGLDPLDLATTQASALDTWPARQGLQDPPPSLYERIFLSPSVLVDGDAEYDFFVLNAQGSELDYIGTAEAIAPHAGQVAAALRLTREELDVLRGELPDDELKLANLTTLYAWTVICRAVDLNPEDAVNLVTLTGLSPLTDLDDLVELVQTSRKLQAAGWTVDELRYLATGGSEDRVAPSDDFVQVSLGRVRDALRAALEGMDEGTTEASIRDVVLQALSAELNLEPDALDGLRGPLDGLRTLDWSGLPSLPTGTTFTLAEDATLTLSASVSATLSQGVRCVLASGTTIERNGTSETLSADEEVVLAADATGSLAAASTATVPQGTTWVEDTSNLAADTVLYVDAANLPDTTAFVGASGDAITLDGAADVTFTDPATAALSAAAAGSLSFDSAPPEPDLLWRFCRDEFVEGGTAGVQPYDDIITSSTIYGDDFTVFHALFKAALLLGHLDLDDEERAYWYANDKSTAWAMVAVDELAGTSVSFDELVSLIVLFEQRQRIPGTTPTFVELLEAAQTGLGEFKVALSERTGWAKDDINAVGVSGQGAEPDSVEGLELLLTRLEHARHIGVSAGMVISWVCAPDAVTATHSAQVVAAARARHADADAWGAVARPLRDVLRKAQRNALVSWLLADAHDDSDIEDADDLYERYLIDVSMDPELLTSRMVQATATVQLFIHRLMMGIERNSSTTGELFEATRDDREMWEWMRTYRVWEAARKVFLYPENWIEPELRDDKTPFFRQLEGELAQGEVTAERVEGVLLDYLDRLREVSNIKILAYWHEKESIDGAEDIDIVHVFGRTRAMPATYWYRRFEDGLSWTAWEEVDCGVEGEHLVPVVHGRRLLLVWAAFEEASTGGEVPMHTEVRLSWSEYRDGVWSPKRVSESVEVSIHSESGVAVLQAPAEDSVLALQVVEMKVGTAEAGWEDSVVAVFHLDPCTLDMAGTEVSSTSDRVVMQSNWWINPGYCTLDPDWLIDSPYASDEIALYVGGVDADNLAIPGSPRSQVKVLTDAPSLTLVVPANTSDFVSQSPFFVQSDKRSWFVRPLASALILGDMGGLREGTSVAPDNPETPANDDDLVLWSRFLPVSRYLDEDQGKSALFAADQQFVEASDSSQLDLASCTYTFDLFYHPHLCAFTEAVRRGGVFALLDPAPDGPEASLRRQAIEGSFDFEDELSPNPDAVVAPYPEEIVEFELGSAYGVYNWELFFHLPVYVASRLMDAGRHEDALKFLHAVFDPRVPASDATGSDPSTRWWKVAPLMAVASAPVTAWIDFIGATGDAEDAAAFARQVDAWRKDPFNPHLIARLRPGTYNKSTVMRYVANLLAWGDQLFTRDTLETLNEATQLYVFARQILGDRPVLPEAAQDTQTKTYAELKTEGAFDGFGNIVLENAFTGEVPAAGTGSTGALLATGSGLTSYFCIPPNPNLLSSWDTVDDRLFKIRHGLDIEGVARTLPLFQPPIDPAMLVRAAAAGLDIGTALDDLSAPSPHHRFQVLHGRATALAGTVRALGGALLSALEKKDAESLAALRSSHEIKLLDAVRDVREQQIQEALLALDGIRESQGITQARRDYYQGLLDVGELPQEARAAELTKKANKEQDRSGFFTLLGGIARALPDFYTGTVVSETGGGMLSAIIHSHASFHSLMASHARGEAGYLQTMAGYSRRAQEWSQQVGMAEKELKQLDVQIEAGEIRVEIARRELANHSLQVAHAEQVLDFMERKFTSAELYQWMVSQLSTLHFQQYQLGLATAKKAQAAYNRELGRSDTFVSAVHWDGLRKGLLAGEKLAADLERMDVAYLDHDKRELEITKTISLASVDPIALVALLETEQCFFELPEAIFDLDHPGHYMRRIKSVSVSVPSITGAHVQVGASVTLTGSSVRTESRVPSGSSYADSTNYTESTLGRDTIVVSRGESDTGLFETNLRDERYLPFEGAGAISEWWISLPSVYEQFDRNEIADVELEIRYTARYSSSLVSDATTAAQGYVNPSSGTNLYLFLSARHHLEDAYATFLSTGTLEIELSAEHFPYAYQAKSLTLESVEASLRVTTPSNFTTPTATSLTFKDASDTTTVSIATPSTSTDFAQWSDSTGGWGVDDFDKLVLGSTTHLVEVEDLFLVFTYKAS